MTDVFNCPELGYCVLPLFGLEADWGRGGEGGIMIWGVKKGGTWRTVRVPDQRHGGQGHSWHHEWCFFTLRKIPWKSCVDILISSVSGRGSQEGGYLEALRVPDRRHGGHGYSWCHELCFFTLRKIPWKFCVDISIRSPSGREGQEGGYLEDVEGSWSETWKTESSLATWMTLVDPKDHILKVLCHYLYFWLRYKDLLSC